ncbi:MAG TPA: fumarylacetoacetate hydrolase family protein [Clostridia bacterium]|jgi:2-keto-4-pentenoate hydratase/2-oxohepta-3-ene-1,7-dioic acid hydratase in catechol pathway|nr:fumarylacetoacetate hydrolase family protein [Clostridia bacterium]HHY06509.1 fumarylacetoacetate hydrolase family protein [Clostridia bacterium]
MKLARFLVQGEIYYGEVQAGRLRVIKGNPFSGYQVTEKTFAVEEVKLLAPVTPGKIIGVGYNYFAHREEFREKAVLPPEPVIFLVAPSALLHPGEAIQPPYAEHEIHYEAELVVVMGKEGRDIPPEKAREYILGYTCGNDVSDRDIQKQDGQWTRAKSFPTFKPLGPVLVCDLEPTNLSIQSRVNGQVKQKSNTQLMIWSVEKLVSFISQVMTLKPGDVIYTGTPAGVGPLVVGDICEIEIEGIGILRNPVKKLA